MIFLLLLELSYPQGDAVGTPLGGLGHPWVLGLLSQPPKGVHSRSSVVTAAPALHPAFRGTRKTPAPSFAGPALTINPCFPPLAWGRKNGFPNFSSLFPFLGPACFNCPHSTPAFGNSAQQTLTPFPSHPLHPPDSSASRRHWEGRVEPGCIPTFPIPGMCPVTHTVLLSTTLAPITRAGKGRPALGFEGIPFFPPIQSFPCLPRNWVESLDNLFPVAEMKLSHTAAGPGAFRENFLVCFGVFQHRGAPC